MDTAPRGQEAPPDSELVVVFVAQPGVDWKLIAEERRWVLHYAIAGPPRTGPSSDGGCLPRPQGWAKMVLPQAAGEGGP
jgi:hypothetical protein